MSGGSFTPKSATDDEKIIITNQPKQFPANHSNNLQHIIKRKEVGRSFFGLNHKDLANEDLESSGTSHSVPSQRDPFLASRHHDQSQK